MNAPDQTGHDDQANRPQVRRTDLVAWRRALGKAKHDAPTRQHVYYTRTISLGRLMADDLWFSAEADQVRRTMGAQVSTSTAERTLRWAVDHGWLDHEAWGGKGHQASYRGVVPVAVRQPRKTLPVRRHDPVTGELLANGRRPNPATASHDQSVAKGTVRRLPNSMVSPSRNHGEQHGQSVTNDHGQSVTHDGPLKERTGERSEHLAVDLRRRRRTGPDGTRPATATPQPDDSSRPLRNSTTDHDHDATATGRAGPATDPADPADQPQVPARRAAFFGVTERRTGSRSPTTASSRAESSRTGDVPAPTTPWPVVEDDTADGTPRWDVAEAG